VKPLRIWLVLLLLVILVGCTQVNVSLQAPPIAGLMVPDAEKIVSTQTPSPTATLTATTTPTPFLPVSVQPTSTSTTTMTPDPNLIFSGPGPVMAPMLMYHHISVVPSSSEYVTSLSQFKQQLNWLKEQGYETITVSELIEAIEYGKWLPHKPVILTFDDGYRDVYDNAYPIMQEIGYTGTMYVIEETLNTGGSITDEIIQELSTAGWEFGNHSATHAYLATTNNLEDEVCGSRTRLIEKYNLPFDSFAYPYADKQERSIQAVIDCGYTSGAGNGSFTIHNQERNFFLSRREVKGYFDMQRFITLVTDIR
jgi:peptidoglycan/xylan/chitin deacetylase (PgdA/CDA1 family)